MAQKPARNLIFSILTAVIILIVIDLGLRFLFALKDRIFQQRKDKILYAAVKDRYPWFKEYLREQHLMTKKAAIWWPYLDYKFVNYKAKYINMDSEGHRKTYNIYKPQDKGVIKIFFYGGSTAWGWGARDEYTIPSYVSRLLNGSGFKLYVENHGVPAYVSTQDLISFLLDLRENKPDIAVFYQGINELYSAFYEGQAGTMINAHKRLNKKGKNKHNLREFFRNLYYTSGIRRALIIIGNRVLGIERKQMTKKAQKVLKETQRREELIRKVVDVYYKNVIWIDTLAKLEGVKVLFYWQPVVYTKDRRTPFEDKYYKGFPEITNFYKEGYEAVKNDTRLNSLPNFKNIAYIFKDDPRFLFFDSLHTFEEGNRDIAKVMAEDIEKLIEGP